MNELPLMLYAEDDENDAFFMARAFAQLKSPQSLRVVPNGRGAVGYLAGDGDYADRLRFPLPRVTMLDVKMPGLSGLEVLSWIRTRRQFDRLPVVMFTSSMQESDIAFSRHNGANAFIVKSTNSERLSVLVAGLMAALPDGGSPAGRLVFDGNLL